MQITNDLFIKAIFLFIFILLFFIWRYITFVRLIDTKNQHLIEYHLDMRFLSKILSDNLLISDSVIFCKRLVEDIKQYYNLHDLIIVDSLESVEFEPSDSFRLKIIDVIKNNCEKLQSELIKKKIIKMNSEIEKTEYMLLITPINLESPCDGFIICVETVPALLEEYELFSLVNSLNLLKTRMMYC